MKHICSMVYVCAIVLLVSGLIGCESTPSGKNDCPGIQAEDYVLSQDLPEQQRKKVLLLHSCNPEYIWVEHLNQGIVKGLAEERYFDGRNTAIKYFYMDTKRKADEGWKRHIAGEAVETIRRMKPDVVIGAIIYFYGSRLTGKIKQLSQTADCISMGDLDRGILPRLPCSE